LAGLTRWTPLGRERAQDHPIHRFGAAVAWICCARGERARGGLVASVLFTADWRMADAEAYTY
jgi:hypothetical protein